MHMLESSAPWLRGVGGSNGRRERWERARAGVQQQQGGRDISWWLRAGVCGGCPPSEECRMESELFALGFWIII